METYSPRTPYGIGSSTKPLGALSSFAAFATPLSKTIAGVSLLPQFSFRQSAAQKHLAFYGAPSAHRRAHSQSALQPDAFMREHLLEGSFDPENWYDFVLLPGTMNARPGMKVLPREDLSDGSGSNADDSPVTSPQSSSGISGPTFHPQQSHHYQHQSGQASQHAHHHSKSSTGVSHSVASALSHQSSPASASASAAAAALDPNVNFTNFCRYGSSCFRKNCRFRHDGGNDAHKSGSPTSAAPNGSRNKSPAPDSLSVGSSEMSGTSTPSSLSPRDAL